MEKNSLQRPSPYKPPHTSAPDRECALGLHYQNAGEGDQVLCVPVQGMLYREEAKEAVLPVLHLDRYVNITRQGKGKASKTARRVASLLPRRMRRARPSYGTGGIGVPPQRWRLSTDTRKDGPRTPHYAQRTSTDVSTGEANTWARDGYNRLTLTRCTARTRIHAAFHTKCWTGRYPLEPRQTTMPFETVSTAQG